MRFHLVEINSLFVGVGIKVDVVNIFVAMSGVDEENAGGEGLIETVIFLSDSDNCQNEDRESDGVSHDGFFFVNCA